MRQIANTSARTWASSSRLVKLGRMITMLQYVTKRGLHMSAKSRRATFATELVLQDVKSFAGKQVLTLTDGKGNPARWTLLLGDNGVGKTTLLECLTQMTPVFNSSSGAGERDEDARFYVEPRIAWAENGPIFALRRNAADACRVQATFVADAILDRDVGSEQLTTSVEFDRIGGKDEHLAFSRWPQTDDEAIPEPEWSQRTKILPPLVLAYGAGRHMGVGNFELAELPEATDSLLANQAELFDAEELLLYLHHASLAPRAGKAKRQKDLLVKAIAAFLPEVGSSSDIIIQGATAIGEKTKQGVFVRTRDGEVPLKQLSFGYQTMMAWIGDIAMRLFLHAPDSDNALHVPAIVVVDEIDLHLHPKWQREMRSLLSAAFPNVQFVATAHSPLLAQAFLDANLAVVMRDGDHSVIENDPAAIADWRIDQIVTSELFGLPSPWPPQIDALFQEHAKLSAKASLSPSERKRLADLEARMLELPTEDLPSDDLAMRVIRESARRTLRSRSA